MLSQTHHGEETSYAICGRNDQGAAKLHKPMGLMVVLLIMERACQVPKLKEHLTLLLT